MNDSIQQAAGVSPVPEISNFEYVSVATQEVETITRSYSPAVRESLSERFHDEIDAWARRSLAANGFGDCP